MSRVPLESILRTSPGPTPSACLILTDSGGVQEGAPSLGKPAMVMRETTERPKGVNAGAVKLVGTNCNAIIYETPRLLTDLHYFNKMAHTKNPYADGNACDRIINGLDCYEGRPL